MTSTPPDRLAEQGRMLSEAVLGLASGRDLSTLLRDIVRAAMRLTDARYGALGVLDEQGAHLTDFIAEGIDSDTQARIGHPPQGKGVLGQLIADPRPMRLTDVTAHPDSAGFPPGHPTITTFLGAPIRVRERVFGNLYLGDKEPDPDHTGFSESDEQMLVSLSAAAGLALESARLNDAVGRVALLTERQRIAADLHDGVVQRLFATGLSLQSAAAAAADCGNRALGDRISRAVDEIDDTIGQLRATIHGLEQDERLGRGAVRRCIAETVQQETRSAPVQATVDVRGPLDLLLSGEQADHLLHALREALSNVVRHAEARQVRVEVTAGADTLTLSVTDDGRGIPQPAVRGSGLSNLHRRATMLGGQCTLTSPPAGGTRVVWRIPLAR